MLDLLPDLIELQTQGAKVSFSEMGRKGGAGPSDDKAFRFGLYTLMVPTLNHTAQGSDFTIEAQNGQLLLKKKEAVLGPLTEVPRPKFYDLKTKDGISYKKIAVLHGSDCLASTVVQECVRYDDPEKRCRFCGIGLSLKTGNTIHTKTPEQLAEVAMAAKNLDGVTHVTLTTGTTDLKNKGAEYIAQCAYQVKKETGLPVHAQFEPPQDAKVFSELKGMGVDNVGIHIESFDPQVRRIITPGKAEINEETYFASFEDAVSVFGRNQVSTYVILGLGEDETLTLDSCLKSIKSGVYPFLVPLRPMANTFMGKTEPPDKEYLHRIYTRVGKMLSDHNLSAESSNSGCVKCKACSMLQFVEKDKVL